MYGYYSRAGYSGTRMVGKKPNHINATKNKKLALKLGIQILTNDDEVFITSLSSILLAIKVVYFLFALCFSYVLVH